MFNATVQDGTNAGWRRTNEPGIDKCACGGFISQANWAAGIRVCTYCTRKEGT